MKRIGIIGGGSWGTAWAILAARAKHDVKLWCRDSTIVETINSRHINPRYLSTTEIPKTVTATSNLDEAIAEAEIVLLATPSHAVRELLSSLKSTLDNDTIFVSVAKGIEVNTGKRVSEVVRDVLGESVWRNFVCLSGPSFAKEVIERHPTAIVAASTNEEARKTIQSELSVENLRIYTNSDVVGTELGGSVKNVMAIAAGMTVGLGYGSNTVAALITRGLAELTRLALSQGGQLETLMGLAGLGDLVLTCTGSLSRNRFVGEELGRGRTIEEISANMSEVAEGIRTTRAVKQLAAQAGIEMPITNAVDDVLYGGKSAREVVVELMSRPLKRE